jgi:hypothetical protein
VARRQQGGRGDRAATAEAGRRGDGRGPGEPEPVPGPDPLTGAVARSAAAGHRRANLGSWLAVLLIIIGFAMGCFALALHSLTLWVITGVALVVGGVVALLSRILEQAY